MRHGVVICGRPNVGKSTLFNILCGKARALVHDRPGVTRDWIDGQAETDGVRFDLVDTAGLEERDAHGVLGSAAWRRSLERATAAAVVLFMVDARSGLLPDDRHIATLLRRGGVADRVVLVVNKAEAATAGNALAEFHALGFASKVVVSATHALGIDRLRGLLAGRLRVLDGDGTQMADAGKDTQPAVATAGPGNQDGEPVAPPPADTAVLHLALIGRPNVGKSTLTNRMVGAERMMVADLPGTTVDSVEVAFEHQGRTLVLIDSAGVRRKARTVDAVEKVSSHRARLAAQRADVILFVVDAAAGIVHQDQALAHLVCGYGKATLVVANKADLLDPVTRRRFPAMMRRELPFMEHASLALVSAIRTGFTGTRLVERALEAHDLAGNRRSPNQVTAALRQAVEHAEPPRRFGKRPRLRYAHQAGVNPPLIIVHGRHVSLINQPYRRYLANQFATRLGYGGAPLQVRFKEAAATPARRG